MRGDRVSAKSPADGCNQRCLRLDGRTGRRLLYRCSRELLRNVLDHAQASNVWMRLTLRPHEIALSIEDDGVGFEPLECSAAFGRGGHYGLQSVREQLAGLGGRFKIAASPGSGTRIRMAIPTHPGNEMKSPKPLAGHAASAAT